MSSGTGSHQNLIPGVIALQKYLLGWIPSENIFINPDRNDVTINLDYIETSPSQSEYYLMGVIPLGENGEFYTIEARHNSEFNNTPFGGIPSLERNGLVIYHYNPSGQLHTNAPNKISGIPVHGLKTMNENNLEEGETFYDYVNDVSITFLSQTPDTITTKIDYDITKPPLGNFLYEIGMRGTLNSQFNTPVEIAIDSSGEVYVVEDTNSRVQVFDNAGNFLLKFETDASEPSFPKGIDIDSNRIYVSTWNSFVQVFDKGGNFLFKFGERGNGDGQFPSLLRGISVDSEKIYITSACQIHVFDKDGDFLFRFGECGNGDGEFIGLSAITVDSERIYVSNNDGIEVFDKDGTFLFKFGESGSEDGQFDQEIGITINEFSSKIYVADRFNDRIQIFDLNGDFIDKFGTYGEYPTQFARPYGLAVNNQGILAVADTYNFRIQVFDFSEEDPCNPNSNAAACLAITDNDGDGVFADTDLDDNDPCNPNSNAAACLAITDNDNDGVFANTDLDDNDPCNPNSNAAACLAITDSDGDVSVQINSLQTLVSETLDDPKDAKKLANKLNKLTKSLNPPDNTEKYLQKLVKDTTKLKDKGKITPDQLDDLLGEINDDDLDGYLLLLEGLGLGEKDLKKLTKTVDKLNTETSPNIGKACKELDGFIKETNKLESKGKLTPVESSSLIDAANEIKTAIGCS